jgi:hypothetical protein
MTENREQYSELMTRAEQPLLEFQAKDRLWRNTAPEGAFIADIGVEVTFISKSFLKKCPFPWGTTAFEIWCGAHPHSFVAKNYQTIKVYDEMMRAGEVEFYV